MEELVQRIATTTGIDPAVARKSVIVIMKFLASEAPPDKAAALFNAIPGAADIVGNGAQTRAGVMGVFNELTVAGLGMSDIQSVGRAFVAYAREKVGNKAVDDVVGAIPGLGQFI